MPNSTPSTSFTVNDVPLSATDPLGAMNFANSSGARNVTRVLSPSSLIFTISATPSTCPDTMCPPSSSPTFSARSRFKRLPSPQSPTFVAPTVSAEISTSNQFCGSRPKAITVKQTPLQAIDAPRSIPSTSYKVPIRARKSPLCSSSSTVPISVMIPVNMTQFSFGTDLASKSHGDKLLAPRFIKLCNPRPRR